MTDEQHANELTLAALEADKLRQELEEEPQPASYDLVEADLRGDSWKRRRVEQDGASRLDRRRPL